MPRVEITGWSKGLQTVSCIQLLHSSATLTLTEAKRVVENVLGGKTQEVHVRSEPDAHLLVSALAKLGAAAHIRSAP